MMKSIICPCVSDFMEYSISAVKVKQVSSPRHVHRGTVYLAWKSKNPSQTVRGTRAAEHVMWYVCPACETVWLVSWHRRDAYLGCMQCHKCHVWSIERHTVWVRGHCSPYTAGGWERDRMPGQHMVTFWTHHFSPPSPPEWVMSWVVVGGAHVTPCDIRLTQCCQTLPCALSWTLGPSNEMLPLPSQACWHWMMCLFIMSDRCHVRHALGPCKVSLAIFLSPSGNSAVDQSRKALAWGRSDGESLWQTKQSEKKKRKGIKYKEEKYGQVDCEGYRKTKRERLRDRDRGREPQMWRGLGRYKSLWCKLLQWWCCGESREVTSSGCVKQYMQAYT